RLLVADVEQDAARATAGLLNCLHRVIEALAIDVGEDEVRAAGGERLGEAAAEPGRGAGDDDDGVLPSTKSGAHRIPILIALPLLLSCVLRGYRAAACRRVGAHRGTLSRRGASSCEAL